MTTTQQRPLWAGRTLALLGIFLVALDLRTAVAALSPIVDEISAELALTPTIIGVLGMLPPVCFAVFGILSPAFTRR
ncbi:MAG: MFS transporter, partial [Leifsonia flava]